MESFSFMICEEFLSHFLLYYQIIILIIFLLLDTAQINIIIHVQMRIILTECVFRLLINSVRR